MPTVATAAAAIGVPEEQILKTLLFASDGAFVVAIANGTAASTARLAEARVGPASGREPRCSARRHRLSRRRRLSARAARVCRSSSTSAWPRCRAYGGGGREDLLLRLSTADVIRLNRALVREIVADS